MSCSMPCNGIRGCMTHTVVFVPEYSASNYHPNINSSEETSIRDGDEDKSKAAEPKYFPGPWADAEPGIRHDRDWTSFITHPQWVSNPFDTAAAL